MRKLIVSVVAIALLGSVSVPERAEAMYARMELSELVAASAMIVVGTVDGTRTGSDGRVVGMLRVDQVLSGTVAPGDTIDLEVPQPGGLISSTTTFYDVGQSGLWFLRETPTGAMAADHPQRFVAPAEIPAIMDALNAQLN